MSAFYEIVKNESKAVSAEHGGHKVQFNTIRQIMGDMSVTELHILIKDTAGVKWAESIKSPVGDYTWTWFVGWDEISPDQLLHQQSLLDVNAETRVHNLTCDNMIDAELESLSQLKRQFLQLKKESEGRVTEYQSMKLKLIPETPPGLSPMPENQLTPAIAMTVLALWYKNVVTPPLDERQTVVTQPTANVRTLPFETMPVSRSQKTVVTKIKHRPLRKD
jgi:hypothetical protein